MKQRLGDFVELMARIKSEGILKRREKE